MIRKRPVGWDIIRAVLAAFWALGVADSVRIREMTGLSPKVVAMAMHCAVREGWLVVLLPMRERTTQRAARSRTCLLSDEGHAMVCGGAG